VNEFEKILLPMILHGLSGCVPCSEAWDVLQAAARHVSTTTEAGETAGISDE